MKTMEHVVNLDEDPSVRWRFLSEYTHAMDELIGCYLNDFRGEEELLTILLSKAKEIVAHEYREEIRCIASLSSYTYREVLIANLYYDALKFYFGCTAFAIASDREVLHARNLDWHTDHNVLSKHSMILDFQKGGETVFKSIGWPGFIGVLSGMKPHQFSVTLNAVLSPDSPAIAPPISFFLRDVLTSADHFEAAKQQLERTPIASDCLLLLSGTNRSELAVIERTPKRFATRIPEKGASYIVVTNDYKKLLNVALSRGILQTTSCGRYDRAHQLLKASKPKTLDDCLRILQDSSIMMGITVQQMVFDATMGELQLIKTGIHAP